MILGLATCPIIYIYMYIYIYIYLWRVQVVCFQWLLKTWPSHFVTSLFDPLGKTDHPFPIPLRAVPKHG